MKPCVICHRCTTIDGKILASRWGKLPGGKDSATLFETTADRFGIGAWIVGTTTMKEFAGRKIKLRPATQPVDRADHVAAVRHPPWWKRCHANAPTNPTVISITAAWMMRIRVRLAFICFS